MYRADVLDVQLDVLEPSGQISGRAGIQNGRSGRTRHFVGYFRMISGHAWAFNILFGHKLDVLWTRSITWTRVGHITDASLSAYGRIWIHCGHF